ncbi:hypothetical protein FNL55_15805 [Tardiphaga sp. vice352]|uniref:hypothetical protein n=1 Tax=Tardiphaga sp. vice352 TaxID=2592816 RepID=UPI001162AE1A|nr:hypothetical protein [Tardiphaga sp. vice352]QDM32651.1 hypothetical protein FNL55_15805 [Tardiphaga sp. vice352]
MSDTLTIDQAASSMEDDYTTHDLVPAEQGEHAPTYDPGTLESGEITAGGLSLEQAVDEFDEDGAPVTVSRGQPVVVTVGGQPLTMADLVNGYVQGVARQDAVAGLYEDYGKVVDAAQNVVQGALALAGYINSKLPGLPSAELSVADPVAYTRLKAVHDETHGIVQQILLMASQVGQSTATVASEHHASRMAREGKALLKAFPECVDEAEREKFLGRVREAVYACDFSESELRDVVDHRLFRLAHLASIGLEKTDRPTPRPRQQPRPAKRTTSNLDRLSRSGTLTDAMAVDFD